MSVVLADRPRSLILNVSRKPPVIEKLPSNDGRQPLPPPGIETAPEHLDARPNVTKLPRHELTRQSNTSWADPPLEVA